jgi:hypothetical protein
MKIWGIDIRRSFEGIVVGLTLLEFIVSIILFIIGHLVNSDYFRGVAVGLTIAWVTGLIAYLVVKQRIKTK